ncbi:hypothetical protein [Paenibacillus amylolyticus]|uniref:hypothetical protein n=1 Tax=Paenibacillus amylolyticus TaxID=1451 RepID=UPI003D978C1B
MTHDLIYSNFKGAQGLDPVHGKVVTMDGSHYLHHTQIKKIAEDVRTFMNEAKTVMKERGI